MVNENEIIIFETEDKSISLPVRIENESVWLNRNQMAELFERDVKTISQNLRQLLLTIKHIWLNIIIWMLLFQLGIG